MEKLHSPVLLSEVLAILDPHPGERYLDLTAGYGGHASKILDVTQNYKDAVLVDRDGFAVEKLKSKFPPETKTMHESFYNAMLQLLESGETFDMILADFGVSSLQLDREDRGFSFRHDSLLDMRMDRRQKLTAEMVVNKYSERELGELFVKYGEEKPGRARMLAKTIVHSRPVKSTKELAELIKSKTRGHHKIHPATKIFQAIRIEVNNELEEIESALPLLPKLLNPGGRVAIITFHSLEDRLVKDYFKEEASHGEESELKLINKKPIVAKNVELDINPRARSAKLRAAIRN